MATSAATKQSIYVSPAPAGLEEAYQKIFTENLLKFLLDLVSNFEAQIDEVYEIRKKPLSERLKLEKYEAIEEEWSVEHDDDTEDDLRNGGVILGDISPADTLGFVSALKALINGTEVNEELLRQLKLPVTSSRGTVTGIQVDFDDGHCPSWGNQVLSYYNLHKLYRKELEGVPTTGKIPHGLIFRPRALNMPERNVVVNGRQVPGGLVDYAVVFYHCYGPIRLHGRPMRFQLAKVECLKEAELYRSIFEYTEDYFIGDRNSIVVSVLVETVASVFHADRILHTFKDRSVSLVCGMWDFCASILSNWPDDYFVHCSDGSSSGSPMDQLATAERNSWGTEFLENYLRFVVGRCDQRNTVAIGGMDPTILRDDESKLSQAEKVCWKKLRELEIGIQTLMVHDQRLISVLEQLRKKHEVDIARKQGEEEQRKQQQRIARELFRIPTGPVSWTGVRETMEVCVFFVYNWLQGRGLYILKDKVEDSATADICLRQLRQWSTSQVCLTNGKLLSFESLSEICKEIRLNVETDERKNFELAAKIVLDLVGRRECSQYITTLLYEQWVMKNHWRE